jgi:hypothetical protein
MSGIVYTIGHSNGTVEKFVRLLRLHAITAVADVRSRPYSRFNPDSIEKDWQSNSRNLEWTTCSLGRS